MRGDFAHRYGPTAVVAGASEGIGAAIAEALAARGVGLVLAARRAGPLEATAERLARSHGVAARAVAVDLAEEAGLDALVRAADADDVGLLVCCAAVSPIGEFLERDEAEHARLLAVNCRAPAVLAHRFGKRLVARGRGGVLFVTSLASHQGSAMVAHYAASKAYERVLAEGLWAELGPHGVDVLACLAGPTDTPTYRAGRPRGAALVEWPPVMSAEAVAEAALDALGHGPLVTPGLVNAAAGAVMRRLLPSSVAIRAVSASTRSMYRPDRR